MQIAIIGCGFVSDFYMNTIKYYPQLELNSVYDKDKKRLEKFKNFYSVRVEESLEKILNNKNVELIINLTNPSEHYKVIKACLKHNKHVYSEKPLGMDFKEAKELFSLAKIKKLKLASAPCSVLSVASQTVQKALLEKKIGKVKLVYANFDAGMTHKFNLSSWKNPSGAFWPALDEFKTGCTYEHAGYFLTWLHSFFGDAYKVHAYSKCLFPDKGVGSKILTPDFSVGCIEYKDVIARVTLSIVAPLDRSLLIVGDKGNILVPDIRDDHSSVYIRTNPLNKLESALEYRINFQKKRFEKFFNFFPWNWGHDWRFYKKLSFIKKEKQIISSKYKPVDFCKGPAEVVDSIIENRDCKLSSKMALNVNEILEVLQYPKRFNSEKKLLSPFL